MLRFVREVVRRWRERRDVGEVGGEIGDDPTGPQAGGGEGRYELFFLPTRDAVETFRQQLGLDEERRRE